MRQRGNIYHGEIKDEKILRSIETDVRNLCEYDKFTAIWAYIVTWFEYRPRFINSADFNYSNTFQLIMTSNGIESYVMFNYIRLDWPNDVLKQDFASKSLFYLIPIKEIHITIENKTVRNLIEKSNMGRKGQWFISFNNTNCRF